MITFHLRQSDCARRPCKNENATTFNFASQIAPSICAVMFTKRVQNDATIFKSRCSRTVVCYRLNRVQALPLVSTRFLRLAHISPKTARSPERWARNIRQEIRRNVSRRVRSTSRQWPDSGNGNAAEHPSGRLARQFALRRIWTRNVRTENLRNISQDDSSESRRHVFNHPVLKL